jgi:hypothetical protein
MFTKSSCLNASLRAAVLSFLFLGAAAHSQPFATIRTTTGMAVDEWESDIIKIRVARPGVPVPSGESACLLDPQDDHGDSFLCATEATLGEAQTGEVAGMDQDVFAFDLAIGTEVSIAVTGEPEVSVGLYAEDGTLVTASARGSRALDAGRFFVRIAGDSGEEGYELTITENP